MSDESSQLPEMSLADLFASARAMGNAPATTTLTVHFHLAGCDAKGGTLTMSRNPTATRWVTTVGIVREGRFQARMAQGRSADESLEKIERYCHWWLGL
jgi:hypothetical protein